MSADHAMSPNANGMSYDQTSRHQTEVYESTPEGKIFARLVSHCNSIGQLELNQEQWKTDPDSLDYVCVDTQRMVMEKARFVSRETGLSGVRVRFWLKEPTNVVDMYFTPDLEPVGWFMPVTLGFDVSKSPFRTEIGFVGMVVSVKRRIVVTGEIALSEALTRAEITEQQSLAWQEKLRHIRYEFMARRYPPAIVRNFSLAH